MVTRREMNREILFDLILFVCLAESRIALKEFAAGFVEGQGVAAWATEESGQRDRSNNIFNTFFNIMRFFNIFVGFSGNN